MKKTLSVILALLMLSSAAMLFACSGGDDVNNDTEADTTADTSAETEADTETEAETETKAETEPETEAPAPQPESDSGLVFDQMDTWHYATYVCPYTDGNGVVGGSAANGHFEEADDEMAAFIKDNPEWYRTPL